MPYYFALFGGHQSFCGHSNGGIFHVINWLILDRSGSQLLINKNSELLKFPSFLFSWISEGGRMLEELQAYSMYCRAGSIALYWLNGLLLPGNGLFCGASISICPDRWHSSCLDRCYRVFVVAHSLLYRIPVYKVTTRCRSPCRRISRYSPGRCHT